MKTYGHPFGLILLVAACLSWVGIHPLRAADTTNATPGIATPEGVEWTLVELQGKPVVVPADGLAPNLKLDPEKKRVTGFAGINRYFGSYKLEGDKLSFGMLGNTRMAGPPEQMEAENAFFKMLGEVNGWRIVDHKLQLLHDDKVVAQFSSPEVTPPK
jgi:heat shock protein HslJ